MDNIGYCCINQTLRKQKVYTGRNLIRRTFTLEKASELALQNVRDLLTILKWNAENGITVFRIGSNLFPRITDKDTQYKLDHLKDYQAIIDGMAEAGKFAYKTGIILSCHPGPYTVLGSSKPNVVESAMSEVKMHALMAELLRQQAPCLPFHINFHVGSSFDPETAERFCRNFSKLPKDAQHMVIIENDDKANCWSIRKLYDHIHKRIGVPLTFDYHHSQFSREKDMTAHDEFLLAKKTWNSRPERQEVHFSTSEDNSPKHSDYILSEVPSWLLNDSDIYIHFEAKQKELAVLKFRKNKKVLEK